MPVARPDRRQVADGGLLCVGQRQGSIISTCRRLLPQSLSSSIFCLLSLLYAAGGALQHRERERETPLPEGYGAGSLLSQLHLRVEVLWLVSFILDASKRKDDARMLLSIMVFMIIIIRRI